MIALFDLDETLTTVDTVVPYLVGWLRQSPARLLQGHRIAATVVNYQRGVIDNTEVKEQLFTQLMQYANVAREQRWTAKFTDQIMATRLLADGVSAVQHHKQQGHRLVLASASPDIYVHSLAKKLGFDDVVATRMRRDEQGRLTGKIDGESYYGEHKLAAVERYLGDSLQNQPTVFYSDSGSDLPLFQRVNRAVVVNPNNKLEKLARLNGLETVVWR